MSKPPRDQDELPTSLDDVDELLQDAREVHRDARGRDLQAATAAIRLRGRLLAHREKIVAKNAAGLGDLSESELLTRLETYAARLPDPHLRIFADTYCARLHMILTPADE